MMKPALLVIDMQKQFFEGSEQTRRSLTGAVEYINAAIALFRKQNLPVICIQHINAEDGLTPEAPGFALPETLQVLPSDIHIHKTYGNAFTKTQLEAELRRLGIDTLIITGYCAEHCVLSAYRGALDHDLRPILLRGGLASGNPENIGFVERISDIISYGALRKVLENC